MPSTLESELAALLSDLISGQGALLDTLQKKRRLLSTAQVEGLPEISMEEGRLVGSLQDCLGRREQLLARAAAEGLPSASLQTLTAALPPAERKPLRQQIEQAGAQARLLQHQALVNWVIIQRTLIHLSQLLEIIATGGRLQPTYGEGGRGVPTGTLVDGAI